jgi:DNA-binding MarR family transcriptional regulator
VSGPDDQLAADAWRPLYELFLAEHERHLAWATGLGASPGDLKAVMHLEPGRGESMRSLADTWRCDASTVTWIVDRLEKQGLAERRPHERDRRVKEVVLSPRGERLREQLRERFHQPPAALAELPRADLEALRRIADRLRSDTA